MSDQQQDTELTLGVGKLLGLFFLLVVLCAVFFSLGYSLGKGSQKTEGSLIGNNDKTLPATETKSSGPLKQIDADNNKATEAKDTSEPKKESEEQAKAPEPELHTS